MAAEESGESRELERIEKSVDRRKMRGVAGAKRENEFGEGEAMTEKAELDLGVIQRWKKVENGRDLLHSRRNDVA